MVRDCQKLLFSFPRLLLHFFTARPLRCGRVRGVELDCAGVSCLGLDLKSRVRAREECASLGLTLALQRRERKEDFRVPYPNSVSVPEYYLLEYSEYYAREKLSRLSLLPRTLVETDKKSRS